MTNFRRILRGVVSLLLIAYLIAAVFITRSMASKQRCAGMRIEVADSSATPFVTPRELARELADLPSRARGMRLSDINTDSIRSRLSHFDKIEHVSVVRLTNDSIVIRVVPMRPIARVFDGPSSYYINRDGKRISADARYRVDVPVIQGHFNDSVFPPTTIIPLLDYLDASAKWGAMVSMIKVDSPTDVLLIPAIRGQVINLGSADPTLFDDKFRRLDKMYTDVVPVKGWNYYDTISVKWNRQVVATRREKSLPDTGYIQDLDDDRDEVDATTMLAGEGVAPGQALRGKKANNEKPIPLKVKRRAEKTEHPADSASSTPQKTKS